MINQYVEENEIERPTEIVVKQVANKSRVKVNIIQSIDRKIPLGDIASSNDLSMEDLLEELDAIVVSGTKVNIDYYLEAQNIANLREAEKRSEAKEIVKKERSNKLTYQEEKARKKLQNKLSKLESQIAYLERELKEIDSQLMEPKKYEELTSESDFFAKYQAKKNRVEQLMTEWEGLQENGEL